MCRKISNFVGINIGQDMKEEKKERPQDNVPDEMMLKYVTAELHDTKKQLEKAEKTDRRC